jgi:hypothetical protein
MQAYADRSHENFVAAFGKAAMVVQMRPRFLLDKNFMRFFLGTLKRIWIGSPRNGEMRGNT